jgi:hypothetical protein
MEVLEDIVPKLVRLEPGTDHSVDESPPVCMALLLALLRGGTSDNPLWKALHGGTSHPLPRPCRVAAPPRVPKAQNI